MNTTKVVIINEDCPSFIEFLSNKQCSLKTVQELVGFKKVDAPFRFKKMDLFTKENFLDKTLNLYECSEVAFYFYKNFQTHFSIFLTNFKGDVR